MSSPLIQLNPVSPATPEEEAAVNLIVTDELIAEYRRARDRIGTSDLVCIVLWGDNSPEKYTFAARVRFLQVPVHEGHPEAPGHHSVVDRVQVSARQALSKDWISMPDAFWLIVPYYPKRAEPLVVSVGVQSAKAIGQA